MPPKRPVPLARDSTEVKFANTIAKYGWMALGVMPVEGEVDPDPPFMYTVGLWRTFDHPELIITGMGQENSHGVLQLLVKRIEEGRDTDFFYEGGIEYPDELPGRERNYPLAVRQVAAGKRDEYLRVARRWNAYEDFPALQMVWPDPECRFPWDEGYDHERFPQELLSL